MVNKQQDNSPYKGWDEANRPQAVGIAGIPAQQASEIEGNKRTSTNVCNPLYLHVIDLTTQG
jgi:hypothetical protein